MKKRNKNKKKNVNSKNDFNIRESKTGKNLISGLLVLGTLGGLAFVVPTTVHADEIDNPVHQPQTTSTNDEQGFDLSELMIPIEDIESEQQLIDLVMEYGPQILFDDVEDQIYIAFYNEENNTVELLAVTEDELIEILAQLGVEFEEPVGDGTTDEAQGDVMPISSEEGEVGVPYGGAPSDSEIPEGWTPADGARGGVQQPREQEKPSNPRYDFGSQGASDAIERARQAKK